MANEVVIKSGRTLKMGDAQWELRDRGVPVEFVDLIAEARHGAGVVHLSFAAGIVDSSNEPIAQMSTRLRMHLGTAQFLHQLLGDIITEALSPPDKSKAN